MIHCKIITWSETDQGCRLLNPVLLTPDSVVPRHPVMALKLAEVVGCRAALTAATAGILKPTSATKRPAQAPARHPSDRLPKRPKQNGSSGTTW